MLNVTYFVFQPMEPKHVIVGNMDFKIQCLNHIMSSTTEQGYDPAEGLNSRTW